MTAARKKHSTPSGAFRVKVVDERLPAGQVMELQRARLLGAVVDATWEVGYARVTIAQVISRARVSRKTFYCLFDDLEGCVTVAFEQVIAEARTLAREAYARESGWCEGVRSALYNLLVAMDEKPALAWIFLVDAFGAGEAVMKRRGQVLAELAQVIDRARTLERSREPPQLAAEGVIGAVFAVLHKRVLEQSEEPLVNLLGPLMSVVVLPYFGSRAANRELRRAPPTRTGGTRGPAAHSRDLLNGLEMRLTYRTMRVLAVISAAPGASNREVADAAGITDQGQISKLMGRLERLQLVENLGHGQELGAANAWHLTTLGAELERVTGIRPLLAS
jgi:AcrR family transcriptional regulator